MYRDKSWKYCQKRMTTPHTPPIHNLLKPLGIVSLLHLRNKLRHFLSRNVEHEVRVAAEHARIEGQRVQARLVAIRLPSRNATLLWARLRSML